MIAVSILVFFINAVRSVRAGELAAGDPWDAATLEWTMSSPPPEYNFAVVPAVNSARPFWLHKHGPTRDISTRTKEQGTPPQPETPPERVDLPSPSGWPILAAFGLSLIGGGALVGLWLVLIGTGGPGVRRLSLGFQPLERLGHPSFGPARTGGQLMDPHATTFGVPSRKMAMWVFIASECMFFGSLIATYLSYEGKSLVGPTPEEILNIPLTSVSTFVLLMSSLAMVLALDAVQTGDRRMARLWLGGVIVLGGLFLGGQVFEFSHFYHKG